ncbi:MAG: FHA domain-containing protein, partial [Trebonia sp.]
MSDVRRCGWCGARLGARDRICFSCQRPLSEPVPLAEPVAAAAHPAPAQPPGLLRLELAWGRYRRTLSLPPTGGTIGSTTEADVVIPAPFLAPVHARVVPSGDGWAVESLAVGGRGQVMVRGAVVPMAPIAEGDVFRLADRVGNFVTVKVPNGAARPWRPG